MTFAMGWAPHSGLQQIMQLLPSFAVNLRNTVSSLSTEYPIEDDQRRMLKWRTFLIHWEVGEPLLPATTPCPAATDLENQTPAPAAMGSRIQCVVSDCHLTYFSSFQFSTKWGKPNLSSKQSPGTALFLPACLRLPHITHSEQDTLYLFPTRARPHS